MAIRDWFVKNAVGYTIKILYQLLFVRQKIEKAIFLSYCRNKNNNLCIKDERNEQGKLINLRSGSVKAARAEFRNK